MAIIDTDSFERRVAAEGYVTVARELGSAERLDDHSHDFDAWGLITSGEFNITVDGETKIYRAGDEFKLAAGCVHSECAGPSGVTFVAGRRSKS